MKKDYKYRICNIDRSSKCREVNSDEPVDRTEDCDHIEQATDDT